MRGVGYTHPAIVASMLTRQLPAGDAPLMDAGTGTGIMGEILTALGYPNVFGFDASDGMLKYAAAKNIYRELRNARLGARLDYADDFFAASVAAGVFTQGHAPLDGLDELIRITRPGGFIVFSISRTYLGETFEKKSQSLETAGKWRRKDTSVRYDSAPLGDDVLMSQVFAFEVI